MAVSVANLTTAGSGTNGAGTTVTGSISPTGGRLLLVTATYRGTSFDPSTAGISTDLSGVSFTEVANYHWMTTASSGLGHGARVTMWAAILPATPGTGTITFTPVAEGDLDYRRIVVDEVAGGDVSSIANAVVQAKTGPVDTGATSIAITLDSAITSGNAAYGLITMHGNDLTLAPGTDFSTVSLGNNGGVIRTLSEYDADPADAVVDASWTSSLLVGGIAIELAPAAAGANTRRYGLTLLGVG